MSRCLRGIRSSRVPLLQIKLICMIRIQTQISPVAVKVFIHADHYVRTTRHLSNLPQKCRKRRFPEKIW